MRTLLGFTQSAFDPASRVRFIQYIPTLQAAGWAVSHRPNRPDRQWNSPLKGRLARGLHYRAGRLLMKTNRLLDIRAAKDFDVVFVNRDLAGRGIRFEELLLRRNPRVVFDFDDAIFAFPKTEPMVRWMCQHAAWVTPGNEYLADYARRYTSRVTVVPTVIDTDRYSTHLRPDGGNGQPVRVGWSGSDQSIGATLAPCLELLAYAQQQLHFEFVVITNSRPKLPRTDLRWTFRPWSPDGEGELASELDVGIMPLVDDGFQRGKCGLKLLQYMAAGLPAVASPVGVNRQIVLQGRTGFLAETPDQWYQALRALVTSAALRTEMGAAGRERCLEEYSLNRWAPALFQLLDRVSQQA
jgi:glycosyltransferase involved in cell wall biosynthesis